MWMLGRVENWISILADCLKRYGRQYCNYNPTWKKDEQMRLVPAKRRTALYWSLPSLASNIAWALRDNLFFLALRLVLLLPLVVALMGDWNNGEGAKWSKGSSKIVKPLALSTTGLWVGGLIEYKFKNIT